MPNNKEPEEKIAYVLEAIRWESGDAKTEIHVIPREDLGKKDCFESIGLFYSDTWDPSKKFYYSLDGSTWFTDRNQENGTLSNEIVSGAIKEEFEEHSGNFTPEEDLKLMREIRERVYEARKERDLGKRKS